MDTELPFIIFANGWHKFIISTIHTRWLLGGDCVWRGWRIYCAYGWLSYGYLQHIPGVICLGSTYMKGLVYGFRMKPKHYMTSQVDVIGKTLFCHLILIVNLGIWPKTFSQHWREKLWSYWVKNSPNFVFNRLWLITMDKFLQISTANQIEWRYLEIFYVLVK